AFWPGVTKRPRREDGLREQSRRPPEGRRDHLNPLCPTSAPWRAGLRSSPAARAASDVRLPPSWPTPERRAGSAIGGGGGGGAAELANAGATVVIGYRAGGEEAEATASEIGCRTIQADVSD